MSIQANVLQYEFFHVGGKNVGSLEEVMAECTERTADNLSIAAAGDDTGPGIKTVLRVYDINGRVTHWAEQIKDLEAKREVHFKAPRNNPISDWYAMWQIGCINRRIEKRKRLIVGYCIEYLGKSFKGEWRVARETFGTTIFALLAVVSIWTYIWPLRWPRVSGFSSLNPMTSWPIQTKESYMSYERRQDMTIRIRIIKTPQGFADKHIRQAWIGIEMPALPDEGEAEGWSGNENAGGYTVSGTDTVDALRDAGKKEAAKFWSYPVPPPSLRFSADCGEVVD